MQLARCRIVECTRHRSQPAIGDIFVLCDRILANRLQISVLKLMFKLDPVLPRLCHRHSENVLELGRIVSLAAFPAPHPLNQLIGRIGIGNV